MIEQPVTSALRALREGAGVGVREMARRLGISPNSYSHYENPNRFKDPYLPMAWAVRFADALSENGVDRSRVLELAGTGEAATSDGLDARVLKLSRKRYDMLLSLLEDLEAAEAVDQERLRKDPGDGN